MVATPSSAPGPVGRDDIVAQLRGVVDHAVGAGGRLALVSGEAGMGKTTLLADTARYAEQRGARVAWGWGWPGDGAPAHWPWLQVLRSLRLEFPSTPVDADASQADAPESARFQLFDEVAARLIDAAGPRPLVILLDDLHWADRPSLMLLDFLAARVPSARLAIVAALRPNVTAPDAALTAVAARAGVLTLAGLSRDAVAVLLSEALDPARAQEVAADVRRRTGGNPFFVQQLGWLIRDGQSGIPPGVGEALGQRLSRLAPIHLDVIGLGAVAGREFSADLLAAASADPDAPVQAALAAGVAHGVLREGGAGTFRFAHDLFREYLYDRMPPAVRDDAHGRIGRALARAGADVSAAELAGHFVHADPASAEAREYSVAAAREATARLAYEDAVRHWERALAAVGAGPDRVDVLLDLAESRRRAGSGRAAEADFRDAADLARATGDPAGLARAALGLHAIGTRTARPPGTVRVALDGERVADTIGHPSPEDLAAVLSEAHAALAGSAASERLRLRVLAGLARVLAWYDIDLDRAAALAAEAVAAARVSGDPAVLAACLMAEHHSGWGPGSASRRRDIAGELVAVARRSGDDDLVTEAELLLAADLMELGDPDFHAHLDTFIRLASASPQPRLRYAALVRRAMLAQTAGRVDEAADLADRAHELGTAGGVPDAEDVWFSQMWDIRTSQDRQDELAGMAAPGSRPARGSRLLERAVKGMEEVTGAQVARMLDADDRPPPGSRRFVADLVFAAEAVALLDLPPYAERLYRDLLPYADVTVVNGAAVSFRGAVAHHLGVLAAALGRTDEARSHLSAAVEAHLRLDVPVWTVRSRFALAGLPADPPADPDALADVADALADVATEARRLGLVRLAREADAAAEDRRHRPPPGGEFRRRGAMWTLGFAGTTIRMRDSKGLRDLATLLAAPGRPVPAADLVGATAGDAARADLAMGADEIFDATARRRFRDRLRDLDEEITEAERHADLERAAKASAEKDALVRELAAAAGFRGGARRLGDQWERARKTATARIRDVIARIERDHPALGAHLRSSVTTGTYCSYSPPSPVTWAL